MTAGRPRKPTVLHEVQGTKRADRHGNDEPSPPPSGLEPPSWLKVGARRVWDELAPPVHRQGLLTDLDVELFAHACTQIAVARRSVKNQRALDIANRILARFGMTPSDRAKVTVKLPPTDPFAERFLSRKR